MFGIVLETENFYLKDFDLKYAADIFYGCVSDAEVIKYLNFEPYTDLDEYKSLCKAQSTAFSSREIRNTDG